MEKASVISTVRGEIKTKIVGQDALIDRLLIALLCDGHVLLEGVPGLAKTKTLKTLTQSITAEMSRVQFTPDLLPSDLIGTEVYTPQTGQFQVRMGPVFSNFLLADEINRAPAKVQSALLQAMEEREVTLGDTTYKLPEPFMVLATQNPIEQEGTYPLPEAQLDRFLMKVIVRYPSYEEELAIIRQYGSGAIDAAPSKRAAKEDILLARRELKNIHLDERLDRYIVSLIQNSRDGSSFGMKGMLDWGASPRGGLALRLCARAHAYIQNKSFVTPDDIKAIATDVLRHRILPSFEAESAGITADILIGELVRTTPIP